MKEKSVRKTLNPTGARVLKRLHYPLDVILTCVRWYVAYPLSLRHLEEMMAERGISVDHSTVHRWAIKSPAAMEDGTNKIKYLEDLRAELAQALGEAIWAFAMVERLTYGYMKKLS